MAVTNKRIIPGLQLTTSAATYYTAPGSTKCVIKRLAFCNSSGGVVTVTVHLVANAGSATAANMITSAKSLASGETWICSAAEGQVLEQGGTVQALASVGASVSIVGSGVEIT